jgi:hypothetical protein
MSPRTFDVKFPCDTQLTFGSLTFAAEEDRELKMLSLGPAPEHLALASSVTSGGSCSGSDPNAGSYIQIAKIVRGIPVVTSILRPLAGALSSSTSASTPNPDLSDDYQRSGPAPTGNPWKAVALSAWWPWMVTGQTTPLANIPPSGDQRRPTPEHRVAAWFRTWIWISTLSGSMQSWKPSSTWHLMAPPLLS